MNVLCGGIWQVPAGRNISRAERYAALNCLRGLRQCDKLPEPIFTPATKEEFGKHDENISFERCVEILGVEHAEYVRDSSLSIFEEASEYAQETRDNPC